MKARYLLTITLATACMHVQAEDLLAQSSSGGASQSAPAQSADAHNPGSASLDQKAKELQAQEQLLLKQVGDMGALKVEESAPQPAPEAQAAPQQQQPISNEGIVPAQVKVQKVEKKAATQPAPAAPSCNSGELISAQAKIKKLQADLDDARNRLMISETEVERLALLVDDQNRRTGKTMPTTQSASYNQGIRVRDAGEIQAKAETDMQIATVISEKAQLRTGPGKENSPLMTVPQGTRLAVETRNGDWYRVISPTGARAWVSSDVIDFGGGLGNPDSAARGKGYAKDPEDAAFEALSKGAGKNR